MRTSFALSFFALSGLLLFGDAALVSAQPVPQASNDDAYWDTRFGTVEPVTSIGTMVSDKQGNLIMTGGFEGIGICVKWDGASFTAMDTGAKRLGSLTLDSEDTLYAIAEFKASDAKVGMWNGTTWSPLPEITGNWSSMPIHHLRIDANDHVYIGGGGGHKYGYDGPGLLKWNGIAWTKVGTMGYVASIATDGLGNVYATGNDGGESPVYVGKWDGTSWSRLSEENIAGLVSGNEGSLYGVKFFPAGNGYRFGVVRWNGSSWTVIGDKPFKVGLLNVDESGTLHRVASKLDGVYIERWDGSEWTPIAPGVLGAIRAFSYDSSGRLYAGGVFRPQDSYFYANFAWLTNGSWDHLDAGGGANKLITDIITDGNGNTYVTGQFSQIGKIQAKGIARWDGLQWHSLGEGLTFSPSLLALDSKGNLYAAGGAGIAIWNGTEWSALNAGIYGYGFPNGYSTIHALVLDDEDNLYVAGRFDEAGGKPARRIAKWDGENWSTLGSGMEGRPNADFVWALAWGSDKNLYAAGVFEKAGGVQVNNIARWDGTAWHPLDTGLIATDVQVRILVLATHEGTLYAGGVFTEASGKATRNIARWDGTEWHALAGGVNAGVWALITDVEGHLYAGGQFIWATDALANHVARWNGNKWEAFGSGLDEPTILNPSRHPASVYALAVENTGSLVIGGSFGRAGGTSSTHIARWLYSRDSDVETIEPPSPSPARATIHPNPVENTTVLTLRIHQPQVVSVSLYDILGRQVDEVFKGSLAADLHHTFEIFTDQLPRGIYFCDIVGEQFRTTRKLVVVR